MLSRIQVRRDGRRESQNAKENYEAPSLRRCPSGVSQSKKRRPAADGGHWESMYRSDGTRDLALQPPCRRIVEIGMPRALHSDAGPARMQCSVHFRPGGGRLLRLLRVSAKIVRSREVVKPDFSQGRRHMCSQPSGCSRIRDRNVSQNDINPRSRTEFVRVIPEITLRLECVSYPGKSGLDQTVG